MIRGCRTVALMLVVVIAASATAATRAYFVEPKEANSAWCPYGGNVGNTFLANVDSIYYIEWFVGELSQPGEYVFSLHEKETGLPMCEGRADVPFIGWKWVRCDDLSGDLRLTKGREYILKVSHSAGDSVCYVYRTDNPYKYGEMVVGGQVQEDRDLCMRLMGIMEPVGDRAFGAVFQQFKQLPDTAAVTIGRGKAAGIRWYRDDFYGWKAFAENPGAVADKGRIYADSNVSVLGILCYGLGSGDTIRNS